MPKDNLTLQTLTMDHQLRSPTQTASTPEIRIEDIPSLPFTTRRRPQKPLPTPPCTRSVLRRASSPHKNCESPNTPRVSFADQFASGADGDASAYSSLTTRRCSTPISTKDAISTSVPARVLRLGDAPHPREMRPHSALESFEPRSFPLHSFAFVRRSTGAWSYAILADRPVVDGPEASLRFVVDVGGSTKVFKRKHWGRCIRLVESDNELDGDESAANEERILAFTEMAKELSGETGRFF